MGQSIGVLSGCFGRKIDGPGFPGGLIIYQGHLFHLKGHLWTAGFRWFQMVFEMGQHYTRSGPQVLVFGFITRATHFRILLTHRQLVSAQSGIRAAAHLRCCQGKVANGRSHATFCRYTWVWVKTKPPGHGPQSLCFHLPGLILGYYPPVH